MLFSPLLAAAAVAIRLDSPGPAIFRQTRVGRHGVPFTLYKFRGMYADARFRFPHLYTYNYEEGEVAELHFHQNRDARVTRIGHVIRVTSIDELPNLVNVILGHMSLVGPRPEIPQMMRYYGAYADEFLSIRPGVTSLAKCSGRDNLSFEETLRLELDYVRHQSFRLDFAIILRTLVAVVKREGVF